MPRQDDILQFCLEELLESPFLRSAFACNVRTTWDRKGLNGGLAILRKEKETPLIALSKLNQREELNFHEVLKYKTADILNDTHAQFAFASTPQVTPAKVAYGLCAEAMDHLRVKFENVIVQNKLSEHHWLAERAKLVLAMGGTDFDSMVSEIRNIDEASITQNEFFFQAKDICSNHVKRAVNSLAGCDVFNEDSYTYQQNKPWRTDLFTKICGHLDEKYVGDVHAIERDWEKNLRRTIREEFPAFEFLVNQIKEANPNGFYMPGFAEFIETPEWKEFCKEMQPENANRVVSMKNRERTGRVAIKAPEKGPFPVERGKFKYIKGSK